MKNWIFLTAAIIYEVIATSSLKSSEGFTKLAPSLLVAGYGAAFYLLSLTLKSIPVGMAYAIWSGLGMSRYFNYADLFTFTLFERE
ncbi:multidrug efflux SMR transporter [Pseudoalteromonas tetraodonis]|nr:multidrug efflux SMR transporter [Pseudoalteromonas tetraodonis]